MLSAVSNHGLDLVTPVVTSKPLHELNNWILNDDLSLHHSSNKFFSFIGYKNIETGQNLILFDQNEIGYLFTACISNSSDPLDVTFFCSLKFEPGNKPFYQLSPTIQKTFSNLKAVHGGNMFPLDSLANYIIEIKYQLLHTEQSNSFLHKKNLNTLALVSDDFYRFLDSDPSNISISFRQLILLALCDSCIHIDLRSCLAPYFLSVYIEHSKLSIKSDASASFSSLLQFASYYSLIHQNTWRHIPINSFASYDDISVSNFSSTALLSQKILGFTVECGSREVSKWDQPLLSYPISHFTLVFSLASTIPHVLVSLSIGPGTRNEPELLPSFVDSSDSLSSYLSLFKNSKHIHRSFQTEEGGRFYQRENSHSLIEVDELTIPDQYKDTCIWVDIIDLHHTLHFTHLCSIELRSILFILFSELLKSK